MPPQGVRLGRTPPKASEVTAQIGLPSWIGSILDVLGGGPDDLAGNAVTPLDLPSAAAVTLFKKANKLGQMVPDVKARKGASNTRWHDLRQLLARDPNVTPEEMAQTLMIADQHPRVLAHMDPFVQPNTEAREAFAGTGSFGLFDAPGRPTINRRPGEDVGRIALLTENMPTVGARPPSLIPETFAHELTHGAQSLWDPAFGQKSKAEFDRITQELIASGQTPAQARYIAQRSGVYEKGAQRAGANQTRRVVDALQKMMAHGKGPLTVSEGIPIPTQDTLSRARALVQQLEQLGFEVDAFDEARKRWSASPGGVSDATRSYGNRGVRRSPLMSHPLLDALNQLPEEVVTAAINK